jgi:ADP-ribosylglycohydrolase
MTTKAERINGAMYGLAYGDAIGFPALFHQFTQLPQRRHDFLWRTNMELDQKHILNLTLPFTHRQDEALLAPCATDDTEFAVFTLQALLELDPASASAADFGAYWKDSVLPYADEVRTHFSERAALDNFKWGLEPPVTGDQNPLHYADSAVPRAVPIGLYFAGQPQEAARVAGLEASVTQSEDGVYAAQAMAAAIAALTGGDELASALRWGRGQFPAESWIAHVDLIAKECVQQAQVPQDLPLLLTKRVINAVYSYGNAAPETLPAAFALVEVCGGDFNRACLLANTIAKSSDSLPAMVGALCGAFEGSQVISRQWQTDLDELRGICLPFLAGNRISMEVARLLERVN